jgi:hypothetical protein
VALLPQTTNVLRGPPRQPWKSRATQEPIRCSPKVTSIFTPSLSNVPSAFSGQRASSVCWCPRASAPTARPPRFFSAITSQGRLGALFDFENRPTGPERIQFFPDIYYRFKFCALVGGGTARTFKQADCAFYQTSVEAAEASAFPLGSAQFRLVNPNIGTAPIFRSRKDSEVTIGIYQSTPVLVEYGDGGGTPIYDMRYNRAFDMANDSGLFVTIAELTKSGAYRVQGHRWERGDERWLPLYEGKMVQAYDHRAASIVLKDGNRFRAAMTRDATPIEHGNPSWLPEPQFWIPEKEVRAPPELNAILAFKDITSPTNTRSMIAAMLPHAASGHTLPLLLPVRPPPLPSNPTLDEIETHRHKTLVFIRHYKEFAPLLLAMFNSFPFDYVARQKIQGNHLTWYLVEQLPFIPRDRFTRKFGAVTAADIIRGDVLALTYTAHDMAAFARDLGHDGPPFRWDAEDRLRRRARLDALFFHLYGLNREEAEYVLGTFPIVREQEEAVYSGRFRTRDLVLNYMAALAAGKPDADVAG